MELTLLRCAVCPQLLADLDDGMAGYKIYDNTFIDVMQGVMLNGGRGNLVHNNYFQVRRSTDAWRQNRQPRLPALLCLEKYMGCSQ